jgi:hypothetical protein
MQALNSLREDLRLQPGSTPVDDLLQLDPPTRGNHPQYAECLSAVWQVHLDARGISHVTGQLGIPLDRPGSCREPFKRQ